MKRANYLFAVMLLLTGCGVAQQMQLNSAAERAISEVGQKCIFYQHLSASEAKAWNETFDASKAQCAHGAEGPIPRENITSVGACYKQLLSEKVRPVSYSPSALNRMKDKTDEVRARYANGTLNWEDYQTAVAKNLADYVEGGKKGSYYNVATCHNEIVSRQIMPVYPYPHLLTQYMADVSAFARQADKQKMDSEDFQVGNQKLWADFIGKEQGAMAQAQAQQTAAWQRTFENLQQLESQQMNSMNSMNNNRTCMTNPATGAYVECYHMRADGTCAHYGPPCL
jgi:hypothetical protein